MLKRTPEMCGGFIVSIDDIIYHGKPTIARTENYR